MVPQQTRKQRVSSHDNFDSGLGSDTTASQGEQGRTIQLLHDHCQCSDNDCTYMSTRTNFIILYGLKTLTEQFMFSSPTIRNTQKFIL